MPPWSTWFAYLSTQADNTFCVNSRHVTALVWLACTFVKHCRFCYAFICHIFSSSACTCMLHAWMPSTMFCVLMPVIGTCRAGLTSVKCSRRKPTSSFCLSATFRLFWTRCEYASRRSRRWLRVAWSRCCAICWRWGGSVPICIFMRLDLWWIPLCCHSWHLIHHWLDRFRLCLAPG